MKGFFLVWLAVALAAAFLAPLACDDDDDDNDDNDVADDDDDDSADDDTGDDDAADDDAAETAWNWVAVAGMTCRDGSATGVGVRLAEGSTKVAVFLQDGGACYDPDSCANNPDHFGEADLAGAATDFLTAGIFDDTNADNPFREWNMVFVPYCTGDIHIGSQPNGTAPGVDGSQQYVGFMNVQHVAAYLATEFGDATQAALLGTSAGGFGSLMAYTPIAASFSVPLALVDDSGPFVDDNAALSPCYQMLLRLLWNVNDAIPAGCTECVQISGDGISNLLPYLAETYPNAKFGLFSAMEDATIRDYWGMGQNHCTGTDPVPGDIYSAALIDERDNFLKSSPGWSTFFIAGDTHGILPYSGTTSGHVSFFDTAVGEDTFIAWVDNILAGGADRHVGP